MKLHHLACMAFVACLAPAVLVAAPEKYKIDPVHSSATFKIQHLQVSNVHGRFNDMSGSFIYDKENPEQSKLEVVIDMASIDTANKMRDEHVRSEEYLNVEKYPKMTYKSTSIKVLKENEFEVTGDITLHGETKPLTLKLTKIGEAKDPKGVYRVGGESTFTIKRSDFGMKDKMPGMLGDDVVVTVAVEGIREGGEEKKAE